jgi:threonine/homoserine/homoserine lactone efflux protein
MELLASWFLWFLINMAASASPGPALVLTVHRALTYDCRTGIFTALGLGMAMGMYVLLVAYGLAFIISKSVLLFTLLKYAGAFYLCFIGIKAIYTPQHNFVNTSADQSKKVISSAKAFWTGLLTNMLNPKSLLFFGALATQFISIETSWTIVILYGVTAIAIESGWLSLLTVFLTYPRIKKIFFSFNHWIERICGGLLIGLGFKLALTKANS